MANGSGTSRSERIMGGAAGTGSVTMTIHRNTVRLHQVPGATFPPGVFNLLFDGHARAQISVAQASETVTFTLPPHHLPSTVDMVAAETGRSLFPSPLSLDPALNLRIEAVRLEDRHLAVEASLAGEAVELLAFYAVTEKEQVFAAGLLTPAPSADAGKMSYAGRLPLLVLLPADSDKPLTLHVSGRRAAVPFLASARAVGVAGYIDQASSEGISGWAADLKRPRHRITLDVMAGERRLGRVTANEPRPDLVAFGVHINSGFTVPKAMLKTLLPGETVSVLLEGTRTHLINSPQRFAGADHIRGLFDNIEGNQACGWVIDLSRPDTPCTVEALCDGRVIGTALANGLRRDVLEAGLPTDRCGFRVAFEEPLHTLFDRDISVRVKDTDIILNGGPQQPKLNPNIKEYLTPDRGIPPQVLRRLRAKMDASAEGCGISLVMPVYNTRHDWLTEALRSVCTQWCGAWELICVDDASTDPRVSRTLSWFAQMEPRIRVVSSPSNEGIAGATSRGIQAARLPYIALMDHDDVLEPDAVHHLIATAKATDADFIYSDEALTAEDSAVVLDVRARPAFSHDYYLSHPYFVHMVAVRTDIAQRIGGFDASLPISADVDFILRAIENSRTIAHIPRVLYRWRTHSTRYRACQAGGGDGGDDRGHPAPS